jgi:DNA-binding NarL/FixJ family response regulator
MRVLLTAKSTRARSALSKLLEQEPELSIVGTADEAGDLRNQIRETKPDLVLLDWDSPDLQSTDLLHSMHSSHASLKVIAFSQSRDARRQALDAGADAFVSREAPWEWFLITLRALGGLSPQFVG